MQQKSWDKLRKKTKKLQKFYFVFSFFSHAHLNVYLLLRALRPYEEGKGGSPLFLLHEAHVVLKH